MTEAIIGASAGAHGYRPLSVGMDQASFARSLRPSWATAAAVVTAPTIVGLGLLLVRTTESFTCTVREDHAGITVRIHGRLHPALLSRLEDLCALGPVEAPALLAPPGVTAPVAGNGLVPISQAASRADGPVGVGAPLPSPSPWLLTPPEVSKADAEFNESTRLTGTVRGSRHEAGRTSLLTLRFENGRRAEISGFALIGRNPSSAEDDPQANLVVVDHETVSKTHLAVSVSDGEAWVADRHSTNGSAVIDLSGNEVRLVPGERFPVEVGTAVRLGDCWARVERLA